jgi:hypothetical protein
VCGEQLRVARIRVKNFSSSSFTGKSAGNQSRHAPADGDSGDGAAGKDARRLAICSARKASPSVLSFSPSSFETGFKLRHLG